MELHGMHLIGRTRSLEGEEGFAALDPRDAQPLTPRYHDATQGEVERAVALAEAAHPLYELAGREARAKLLETIADGIEGLGSTLLERAAAETGLPFARFENERGRTTGQLRLFASVARRGDYLDLRIDPANPARQPAPKPDLRSMRRALGPVAVFGASNFPLAFSVAGGDSAAALAAGCPIVVKGHPSHPGTSEMVGRVIVESARSLGLPEGTFSLLQGRSTRVGSELVQHPAIRAVAFTGSLRGGRALHDLAANRPEPIPVFAEMGSTNPVFLLVERLTSAAAELATQLANSVTLGVGQFCTNPGLIVLPDVPATELFLATLRTQLAAKVEAPMLHPGIRTSYDARLSDLHAVEGIEVLLHERAQSACGARSALFATTCERFLAAPTLHEEVFGPSTLVVRCRSFADQLQVARALHGQLTATIHAAPSELESARTLARILEQKAGRLLFAGVPTGVEVSPAMVHGGPYPATTDSRTTSVGTAAIDRFLRPVCYQDCPEELLPDELRS